MALPLTSTNNFTLTVDDVVKGVGAAEAQAQLTEICSFGDEIEFMKYNLWSFQIFLGCPGGGHPRPVMVTYKA
jgi:hypothetical protein